MNLHLIPDTRRPYGTGRGPGSHLCPAGQCREPVSADRLMCRHHWYQVPKTLRDLVWSTWRSGAGTGTPEHTDAILNAIAAAAGHTPAPITDEPDDGELGVICPECRDAAHIIEISDRVFECGDCGSMWTA